MCGWGRTSRPRPGARVTGPMRSKKTNGPTMRCPTDGRARRTVKPSPRSRTGGTITVWTGSFSCASDICELLSPVGLSLQGIDEHDLAFLDRAYFDGVNVIDCNAVPGIGLPSIDFDPPRRRDQIGVAARRASIARRLPGGQRRGHQTRIGADRQRVACRVLRLAGRQGHELAGPVALGKGPHAPAGRLAGPGRLDPDLEEGARFILQIIF